MAERKLILAVMALAMVLPARAARSACTRITLLVNGSSTPWSHYWQPTLTQTSCSETTCFQVMVGVKLQEKSLVDLSKCLSRARNLDKLTLGLQGSHGIDWNGAGMHALLAAVRALPIKDFTLWASTRDYWPTDAVASLMVALPTATSATLKLSSTKQTDNSVASWANALPATLQSLSVDLNNNPLSSAVGTIFTEGLGFASGLRHVNVHMRYTWKVPSESKIEIFQVLQKRKYDGCSLMCDNITDVAGALAGAACSGKGNCKASGGRSEL